MKRYIAWILLLILSSVEWLSGTLHAIDIPGGPVKSPHPTPRVQDSQTVIVDFSDINERNAGQVLGRWNGTGAMVKQFVLPEGFSLKLDESILEKAFSGSTKLKRDFEIEKSRGIAMGELEEGELELLQYPDRVTIKKKLTLKIKNATEFANYRQKFEDMSPDPEREKLEKQTLDILIPKCKADPVCSKGLKNDAQIRAKVAKDMVGEQEIEMIDSTDFSLIPLDLEDTGTGRTANRFRLDLDPADVRISRAGIMSRFARLKAMRDPGVAVRVIESDLDLGIPEVAIRASDALEETRDQMDANIRAYEQQRIRQMEEQERRMNAEERRARRADAIARENARIAALPPLERRCQSSYIATEPLYEECMDIGRAISRTQSRTVSRDFINGFTKGASFQHGWEKVKRVPIYGAVFRARASISMGYAVGVRLPFEFAVKTPDTQVLVSENQQMTVQIKATPKNMDAEGYLAAGIPADKVHDGKEFVLKAWANATVKVVVCGHDVVNRENIDLLRLIGLESLDESKNFTPKIDNSRMMLVTKNLEIPVIDLRVVSLNATVGISGSVKSQLSGACSPVDLTMNACDDRFSIRRAGAWQPLPAFSPNWVGRSAYLYMDSAYGPAQRFAMDFHDFEIRSSVIVDVLAGGTVVWRVPYLGKRTWNIWPWSVYSFEFSDGYVFESHRGTRKNTNVSLWLLYASDLPPKSAAKLRHEEMLMRNADILLELDLPDQNPTPKISVTGTGRTIRIPTDSGTGHISRVAVVLAGEDDASVTSFLVQKGLIRERKKIVDYRLDTTISRGETAKLMGGLYNDFLSEDLRFDTCSGKIFSDVRGWDFCPYIEILAEKGLLSKNAKTFRPDDSVSRAEFITMLLRSSGKQPVKDPAHSFRDLPQDSAHAGYIAYAVQNQLFTNVGLNFRPNDPVTRREVFLFIKRLRMGN